METRVSTQYYLEHFVPETDRTPIVTKPDFLAALSMLVPSVSPQELARYAEIQEKFK